jgi:hypothetical protein
MLLPPNTALNLGVAFVAVVAIFIAGFASVLLLLMMLPTASRQSSARIFTDTGCCMSNPPRSRRCHSTLDFAIAIAT